MNNSFDFAQICKMIDISAVYIDASYQDIEKMMEIAKKYKCICVSPMPWATKMVLEKMADTPDIVVTGAVGFPSGGETTLVKAAATRELVNMGCKELDMVMNVGAFKSGDYETVERDIRAVVEAAGDVPVKTIIEICRLTDDEIRRASEICVKAGAAYVKTGTGWGPAPTTVDTIRVIRSAIGDSVKVKAAGGVRDINTMLEMIKVGCDRFGIGARSAESILSKASQMP